MTIEDSRGCEEAEVSLQVEIDSETAPVDASEDVSEEEILEEAPRQAWKPDVSHLADAVQKIEGVSTFVLGKGDRLVIDYTGLTYGAWLDTRCWMITSVDESGYIGLWDPQQQQFSCTDWKIGIERGLVMKVAGTGDWKQPRKSAVSRNSPKRNAVLAHMAATTTTTVKDAVKETGETHRGRKKGTLNSKTVARLAERGMNAAEMTREQVDEAMAKIRKDEYEAAKAERRRQREAKGTNKDKVS